MSLIKCDECGEPISHTADVCPKCGRVRTSILARIILAILLSCLVLLFVARFLFK